MTAMPLTLMCLIDRMSKVLTLLPAIMRFVIMVAMALRWRPNESVCLGRCASTRSLRPIAHGWCARVVEARWPRA